MSITRAVMRALLKTSLVEEVLQDLNRLLSDISSVGDTEDVVRTVFEELHVPYNPQVASQCDMNQCFILSAGVRLGSPQ